MVGDTLSVIENWFQEPTGDKDRPMLLSKLAVMEFCGWIEEWMDGLIRDVNNACLRDPEWIEIHVIKNTNGFHYAKHFRPMICRILGEHRVREFEAEFERQNPGALGQIQCDLGYLWTIRCKLAHADVAAHRSAQVTINAPSWTKNQFRVVSKRLDSLRQCLLANC